MHDVKIDVPLQPLDSACIAGYHGLLVRTFAAEAAGLVDASLYKVD